MPELRKSFEAGRTHPVLRHCLCVLTAKSLRIVGQCCPTRNVEHHRISRAFVRAVLGIVQSTTEFTGSPAPSPPPTGCVATIAPEDAGEPEGKNLPDLQEAARKVEAYGNPRKPAQNLVHQENSSGFKRSRCWSWRRGLNPRPSDYKSDALPTELRQLKVERETGIGPATNSLEG